MRFNTLIWTFRTVLAAMMVLFLLSGCSGLGRLFGGEEEEKAPAELMTEGMENLDRGYYTAAVEAFEKIKDRYPYSQYAVLAELRMADALYKTKEFDSAYKAYDEFEKLHPKYREIPYVVYQKGMCNFMQVKSIDREQEHTRKAKAQFERLIMRFPGDRYAIKARRKLRKCLVYLAEYELYVGRFYFSNGWYRAALGRYTYVIKNYPDMGQYNEAVEYISRCREKLAEAEAKIREEG